MSSENEITIDLTYLSEVASANTEFMVEMIVLFQEQTPGYLELLESAIENKDWVKIAQMAHKIKPTLAFIGVDMAKEKVASIETRARDKEDHDGIKADFEDLKEDFKIIFLKLEDKKNQLLAGG